MNLLPKPPSRPRWKPPEPPHLRPRRDRETLLLAASLVAVLLGLALVYLGASAPFSPTEAQIQKGEILDLSTRPQTAKLAPFLTFVSNDAERGYLAERIYQHLARTGVELPANVGELGKIRVSAADLEKKTAPGLRQRLAKRQARLPEGERAAATVRLLSEDELRELKPNLVVRTPGEFRRTFWLWAGLPVLAFLGVHAFWRQRRFRGDQILLPLVALLSGLGLMVMASVRDPLRDLLLVRPFSQGLLLGCVLLAAVPYLKIERSPLPRLGFAALGTALLLSVLLIAFGGGPGGSDAKVNLLGFQPVEAVKILLVLFFAAYFAERWEFLRELNERRGAFSRLPNFLRPPKLEYALPPFIAIAVVLTFFFFQRDLGPALVFAFLFLLLYGTASGKALLPLAGSGLVIAGFYVGYLLRFPSTVAGRIEMWLSPWDNFVRGGDHLAHSLWAFATGAITGTGLGLGAPQEIPEAHTDLVLAVLGEELGFLGLLLILALYAILVWRGLDIARKGASVYSFFLALGLALVTALQLLLIVGGSLGVIPLSGVVTPFLSYGRSSLIASFAIVALLLAVSAERGNGTAARRFQPTVRWTSLALAALLLAVVAKAAYIQVIRADPTLIAGVLSVQGDEVRRFRYNPRLLSAARQIPRGTIFDRNGLPLASSNPEEIASHRKAYDELRVPQVELEATAPGRLYPLAGRTFHLLGDLRTEINWAAANNSFIERDMRVRLQGYDDRRRVIQARQLDGSTLPVIERDLTELVPLLRYRYLPLHPAVRHLLERPRQVQLALDARLQTAVGDALAEVAQSAGSEHGAAVVLDVASGDLLASISFPWPKDQPSFDAEREADALLDRARYGLYPPGSTFKVVTAMAALRHDPGIGEKTFDCVPLPDGRAGNRVRGWGRAIRDDPTVHRAHGRVNLERGIAFSCNAYFAQLAVYEVQAAALLDTAGLFDIQVAKPNTPGQLRDALPQAAYGQGQVAATPFQMARVAATVANGGSMPQGRWVIDDSNTRLETPRTILGARDAEELAAAMRRVVTEGSAAGALSEVHPAIAGKTGTAEVPPRQSHSWFIGFVPYAKAGEGTRKIAFSVIIENGGYGGRVAARVAEAIVRQLSTLGYWDEGGSDAQR